MHALVLPERMLSELVRPVISHSYEFVHPECVHLSYGCDVWFWDHRAGTWAGFCQHQMQGSLATGAECRLCSRSTSRFSASATITMDSNLAAFA